MAPAAKTAAVKTGPKAVIKKAPAAKARVVKDAPAEEASVTQDIPVKQPVQDTAEDSTAQVAQELAETAEAVAAASDVVTVESLVSTIGGHFASAEKEIRAGKALLKKLLTTHGKDMKAAAAALKSGRRKRERDPNAPKRAPSGIAKPAKISPELAEFLGVAPDVELARTDVIRQVAGYIKAHNLENPENRREILPDEKLAKLLKYDPNSNEKTSYFNL